VAFAALQLEAFHALGAVHPGDALLTGVQTLSTGAGLHEVTSVARAHTFIVLEQQIVGAC
jgi:hypothetical protein